LFSNISFKTGKTIKLKIKMQNLVCQSNLGVEASFLPQVISVKMQRVNTYYDKIATCDLQIDNTNKKRNKIKTCNMLLTCQCPSCHHAEHYANEWVEIPHGQLDFLILLVENVSSLLDMMSIEIHLLYMTTTQELKETMLQ
jgi:hypothetical protein